MSMLKAPSPQRATLNSHLAAPLISPRSRDVGGADALQREPVSLVYDTAPLLNATRVKLVVSGGGLASLSAIPWARARSLSAGTISRPAPRREAGKPVLGIAERRHPCLRCRDEERQGYEGRQERQRGTIGTSQPRPSFFGASSALQILQPCSD